MGTGARAPAGDRPSVIVGRYDRYRPRAATGPEHGSPRPRRAQSTTDPEHGRAGDRPLVIAGRYERYRPRAAAGREHGRVRSTTRP
ncbi:hypothetical protein GCM10010305_20200 [Streptomyces termitum]|uniref:Uncharacterized protein n=1 Tax=Streptomyces termitum TaxID=67368 RepID=A0A918SXV5_9ACTN|nr:hypothetical protein GCM10010305_20200 [Streptomyces termitum]